jgi:hypothetical protein
VLSVLASGDSVDQTAAQHSGPEHEQAQAHELQQPHETLSRQQRAHPNITHTSSSADTRPHDRAVPVASVVAPEARRGIGPLAVLAGISGVLAAPLGFATLALGVIGAGASIDVLADPTPFLQLESRQIDALRWANLCSIFGYGLLLVPVAVYLYELLDQRSRGLARLAAVCAIGYVGFATTNAVVLWSAWPVLQRAYPLLDPGQRTAFEAVFRAITDTLEIGVEAVMYLLGGTWWLVVGLLLLPLRRVLAWFTLALGCAAGVGAIGLLTGFGPLATPALALAFLLTPVWSAWVGLDALRRQGCAADCAPARSGV